MPGLLDGQIASAIYAGFKGRLLTGVLRRVTPSGTTDELGDADGSTATEYDCQGFTDGYSDHHRAIAGIPLTDVRVSIFAKSLPAGLRPQKDDMVSMTQAGVITWYQLRRAEVDPAGALWECQAFAVDAPLESA